jgi:hypothetical protein
MTFTDISIVINNHISYLKMTDTKKLISAKSSDVTDFNICVQAHITSNVYVTNRQIPWKRLLPEKLTAAEILKKFHASYGA